MDLEQYTTIISENRKNFVGKAFRILGNWDTAEDVVQRTLSHLESRIGNFKDDGRAAPTTWIMTAVIRRSLNELRDQKRRIERMLEHSVVSPDPFEVLTTEWVEREKEFVLELIREWIDNLEKINPTTARIMKGFYVEGKPWAIVAQEVGISEGACKLRAMYTRRKWKKQLQAYFMGREDVLKDILNA